MEKKYHVKLTPEERERLTRMVSTGKSAARLLARARVLLKADESEQGEGWNDDRIAEALDVGLITAYRIRKQFVEEGLDAALTSPVPANKGCTKLNGRQEAHLIALMCQKAPEGRERWTLRLLADEMVALGHVDSLSFETVRQTLKKTNLSPGKQRAGVSRTLRAKHKRPNS